MSGSSKERFEDAFRHAVSSSLVQGQASEALRTRLLEAITQVDSKPPEGVRVEDCDRFTQALSTAVERSQDWAARDQLAQRVESALNQEFGCKLRSERAVHSQPDDGAKSRYLQAFSQAVRQSEQSKISPESCRQKVLQGLKGLPSQTVSAPKVVALPEARPSALRPSRWKQMMIGIGSIAAGFALLMGTLMGSAEQAMAASVRQDHQRCCSAMKGSAMKRCASLSDSDFGPLPTATVAAGWDLVASKLCHDGQGKPMIHNVYAREQKTISLHFWPPQTKPTQAKAKVPRQIAGDGFPVLAWDAQGWTITACSDDVDSSTLAALVIEQ